jgi:hypothetical protein
MRFKDLTIGQTFDWIDDENPSRNHFFHRCRKISPTKYETVESVGAMGKLTDCRVGTTVARVYHVEA